MKILLGTFEERLSNVPRWTIVRTIQKQNVAEHSYRVALIALRLCPVFFSQYHIMEAQLRVVHHALLHDQWEAFTGDIPTPAGRRTDKKALEEQFRSYCVEVPEANDQVKACVKVADFIEALVFLSVEQRLGNASVDVIAADVYANLKDYLASHGKLELLGEVDYVIETFRYQHQDPLCD